MSSLWRGAALIGRSEHDESYGGNRSHIRTFNGTTNRHILAEPIHTTPPDPSQTARVRNGKYTANVSLAKWEEPIQVTSDSIDTTQIRRSLRVLCLSEEQARPGDMEAQHVRASTVW